MRLFHSAETDIQHEYGVCRYGPVIDVYSRPSRDLSLLRKHHPKHIKTKKTFGPVFSPSDIFMHFPIIVQPASFEIQLQLQLPIQIQNIQRLSRTPAKPPAHLLPLTLPLPLPMHVAPCRVMSILHAGCAASSRQGLPMGR